MENKSAIDKQTLDQAILNGYGIEINHLEFLLRGFGGDCYRAVTRTGLSYFLKLYDPVLNQMTAASSRSFYLPLMHQLHAKGILPHIPYPLPALDGRLSFRIGPNELVITNFIEGQLVGFGRLPEPILARLAEMVGILHRSISELEFKFPFIEGFEIAFESGLLKSFDTLSSLPAYATQSQKSLREIILPRKSEIAAGLKRLKKLQNYARNLDKTMVICHTDLHGGNLMTDGAGKLYILDWENAMIAPPEHDIFFFAGENGFWELFWPHYTRQFSSASIDSELLRFYFYRRALEDIADFIFRILRGENSPDRDEQEIEWMVACLEGMSQIDSTVTKIRKRL